MATRICKALTSHCSACRLPALVPVPWVVRCLQGQVCPAVCSCWPRNLPHSIPGRHHRADKNHTTLRMLSVLVCVQVASGSRVSGSLIAALEVLHQGDMAAVGASVASMAWQQLQALPTSLLWDLAWLVQDGYQQQDAQQVQLLGGLLRHYVQVGGQEQLQALDFPVRCASGAPDHACGTQT